MSQIRSKNGLNGFIVIYHISRNSSHSGSYILFQSASPSLLTPAILPGAVSIRGWILLMGRPLFREVR